MFASRRTLPPGHKTLPVQGGKQPRRSARPGLELFELTRAAGIEAAGASGFRFALRSSLFSFFCRSSAYASAQGILGRALLRLSARGRRRDLGFHLEPDAVTEHGEVTWQTDSEFIGANHAETRWLATTSCWCSIYRPIAP